MLEDQEMIAVAQGIIDTEIQGLEKLKKSIGRELIEAAKTIYESRGKLIITGIGKTGAIGRKIAATLSSTGTTTIFMNSTEGLHGDLDRKSTRLNSSHANISYAVFCLKKKN